MSGHPLRRVWRSRAVLAMAILAGAAGWHGRPAVAAQAEPSLEHRVKAAFLYRFADYTQWPETAFGQPGTPFTIGVAGAEPLTEELARIVKGRTAHKRPVVVRRVKPGEPTDGIHILFVGREHRDRFREWVVRVRERPVLLVTEWEGALAQGSMVNFVILDERVRFEIALESARAAGLAFDSRLLTVAHQVQAKGQ